MKNLLEIEKYDVDQFLKNITRILQPTHPTFFNEISVPLHSIYTSHLLLPIEKYHQILLLLNHHLQNLQFVQEEQKPLIKDLIALMILSLRDFSELKLADNHQPLQVRIDQSMQNFSMHLKFDPKYYDSLEHYIYCYKWRVSGCMQDYSTWNNIEALFLHSLDQDHYTRIVAEALLHFGLNMKSEVINSDDLNYDQYGTTTHNPTDGVKASIDIKAEIDIWKPENIAKLCLKYMEYYAHQSDYDVVAIEEKAAKIRHHVLVPLYKEFVNQARKLAGLHEYSEQEMLMQLADYDQRINQLKQKACQSFTDQYQKELIAIDQASKMLHSILKQPRIEEALADDQKWGSFIKQHPVLINSLKGVGYGLSAFVLLVGGGAVIYTTGGVGAVFIAGMVKALGLTGSVAVSAAATAVPGGIIGAGIGVSGKKTETPEPTKKKVHFSPDAKDHDGPRYDLTYNRYYQKFMEHLENNVGGIKQRLQDVVMESPVDELTPLLIHEEKPLSSKTIDDKTQLSVEPLTESQTFKIR